MRVFPLSNWTEFDIWSYIMRENIEIVPLYLAADRPTVMRDGSLIMVDDARMRLLPGEAAETRRVRFRSLGCYPLTAATVSDAQNVPEVVAEIFAARSSERGGRLIDRDEADSMEKKKREGYF
jgi:sulfate adenylyltransferase subunit 2